MVHRYGQVYSFLFRGLPNPDKIRKYGGIVHQINPYCGSITAIVTMETQLDRLRRDPDILLVEQDRKLPLSQPQVRWVMSKSAGQFSSRAAGFQVPWHIARVLGNRRRPNQGKGVRVGVIDTGIDFGHPDLAPNFKGGINLVNPHLPPQDDHGHGTHIAGTIGAAVRGHRMISIVPSVSLFAIKVLNGNATGTLTTLIKGIEWGIQNKMHILNISVGGGTHVSPALLRAVRAASKQGILIVAAAGNNGRATGQRDSVEVPGRLVETVAVAALKKNNRRAHFSATGSTVDIAAPGVDIISTYLGNRYAMLSGTSMAAAHVTGVAALLKCADPKASPQRIKGLLSRRAIDLPPAGKDPFTGAGLVQVG